MNYTDRYYQRDCIEALPWSWEFNQSTLINLATGAGKNYIMARAVKALKARCLVVGDQNELIDQPLAALSKFSGIIAAVERAGDKASLAAKTVVTSVQTMRKPGRHQRFPRDHFDYIFIDEAHRHCSAKAEICAHFNTAKVCGMTATPFRSDMRDLSKWYQDIAYAKPMLDLVAEGFAPDMLTMPLPVEVDLAGVGTGMTPDGKDYKPDDSAKAIAPYMEAIADLVKEYAPGRHGIARLPLIEMSKEFAAVLRRHGITARHVDGGSPDRQEIIEGFARGEFDWICNAGVIGTGVDVPIADCFLPLAPMKSAAQFQQNVGRIMRPLPGCIDDLPEQAQAAARRERLYWSDKPNAIILDPLWLNDKLGVARAAMMVSETEEEAAAITAYARKLKSPEDLALIKAIVKQEKEAALVNALERAADRADMKSPVAWGDAAVLMGDSNLIGYEPTARWELVKPLDFQLRILFKKGVNPATVATKGHATALLRALDARYKGGLATLKQVRFIFRMNGKLAPERKIPAPERLTFAAASEIIGGEMGRIKLKRIEAAATD